MDHCSLWPGNPLQRVYSVPRSGRRNTRKGRDQGCKATLAEVKCSV